MKAKFELKDGASKILEVTQKMLDVFESNCERYGRYGCSRLNCNKCLFFAKGVGCAKGFDLRSVKSITKIEDEFKVGYCKDNG